MKCRTKPLDMIGTKLCWIVIWSFSGKMFSIYLDSKVSGSNFKDLLFFFSHQFTEETHMSEILNMTKCELCFQQKMLKRYF